MRVEIQNDRHNVIHDNSAKLKEDRDYLLSSLERFTKYFFKLRAGRDFTICFPPGRESHHKIIFRELTDFFELKSKRLLINIPPGYGKSELLIHFVAWAMGHYPDCNFLYISFGHDVASGHTATIKQIMSMPEYQRLFDVKIRSDSKAKDNFQTIAGGTVRAFGSSGAITGKNAGIPFVDRFSGCILIDDPIKPDDVHSETIREGIWRNYQETIIPRARGDNVGTIAIGQRLHQKDTFARLVAGEDGQTWRQVILPAVDENNNVLNPDFMSYKSLMLMKEHNKYTFWSQQQQNPELAGEGIFNAERFILHDDEPEMLLTFITADTAETDKDYNDATAFSFWGIYRIKHEGIETELYGLHWINCWELRIEPCDLKDEFLNFWRQCMQYPKQPSFCAIEKKSTGTTLISVLNQLQGLDIQDIPRTIADKNKITRYLATQQYVSQRLISLPKYGRHTEMCINHMSKIVQTGTHAHDDIADTFYDAVKMTFIDKTALAKVGGSKKYNDFCDKVLSNMYHTQKVINKSYNSSYS